MALLPLESPTSAHGVPLGVLFSPLILARRRSDMVSKDSPLFDVYCSLIFKVPLATLTKQDIFA